MKIMFAGVTQHVFICKPTVTMEHRRMVVPKKCKLIQLECDSKGVCLLSEAPMLQAIKEPIKTDKDT
jgi:hypothetical protein